MYRPITVVTVEGIAWWHFVKVLYERKSMFSTCRQNPKPKSVSTYGAPRSSCMVQFKIPFLKIGYFGHAIPPRFLNVTCDVKWNCLGFVLLYFFFIIECLVCAWNLIGLLLTCFDIFPCRSSVKLLHTNDIGNQVMKYSIQWYHDYYIHTITLSDQ